MCFIWNSYRGQEIYGAGDMRGRFQGREGVMHWCNELKGNYGTGREESW